VIADTKALLLAGLDKEEGRIGGAMAQDSGVTANSASCDLLRYCTLEYNRAGVHSHKCQEMDLAKIII
jgi:hypothetical protein